MSSSSGSRDSAQEQPRATANNVSASDLEQAFKDLAKGEQTATAMENRLSQLERRIDDLLASVDEKVDSGHSAETPERDEHRVNGTQSRR